jgi:hypothetical protein
VTSNTIEIDVIEPAPPAIRTATQAIRLLVVRDDGSLVARMTSTWDRPIFVNLNLGPDMTRYAQFGWSVRSNKGEPVTVPAAIADGAAPAPAPVEPGRLRLLQPGEKMDLGRIDGAALLTAARKDRAKADESTLHVAARYANQVTREDLRQMGEKGNASLRAWAEKSPYPVFTGAPDSRAVPLFPPGATSRPAAH